MMRGVSTREYHEVLPQMAANVGVSKSAVSRQAIEASAEQLKLLQERRWDGVEILVITSVRLQVEQNQLLGDVY